MNRNGNRTGSKPLESGFPPLLLIVLEGKGGVAKSVTADAAHYCFSSLSYVTLAAESDTTNSIMSSTHDDVVFVSAGKAGWHTTIFPPYFVAGAIYSGFAMVLTLMIPARRLYRIEHIITTRHLDSMAKMLLVTGWI
ncbi:MAG: polysulfide reductase NrfD, partial [Bosea sp.]|nr:polysulfide reductase NrfD [Bosea sp. (in: a-proteobacteria)]